MSMKLMYITNNPYKAKVAEKAGIDWIFIDLEKIGKDERQKNLDTVKSKHSIEDISKIKKNIISSELLVRINPIHNNTENEINEVISAGAEIIMLPYFKTKEEVDYFISKVNGRVKTCLLLETSEAVENLDSILELKNIDYIHIGLNDLHLSYKLNFMFEPVSNGTVERIIEKIKQKNIKYGFGGIAKIGEGTLPAERILAEHYRLGSQMVIISRSFTSKEDSNSRYEEDFIQGIQNLRNYENVLTTKDNKYFEKNKQKVKNIVNEIITTK
ncbi:2-keto-3-deoxy-L-rhamnonate aldolase [Jeotgalicoccus saudimassiliensis]|uniref:2-keto-3-deoxy-L-rhamnonate aldolase n=1 Tax=Jeotgalicoccus saudimassiliensis TaxID=1461582 RepID=A0A078LZB9_9STAP|nr:aldolase/citrate lyase family protein [Jeotgalicoccus saudimassiliensis]CEA00483.1 2-keto-3-deoxy-L-rhamnonate aldolase [Jeotgalicoccus saudimassiliensis]